MMRMHDQGFIITCTQGKMLLVVCVLFRSRGATNCLDLIVQYGYQCSFGFVIQDETQHMLKSFAGQPA